MNLDEIGTALMLRRRQRGLSQEDVAKQAGLSRAIISLIELGAANPTMNTLCTIARVLKYNIQVELSEANHESM